MSELRELVRARLIRMRDVDLRETPGLIAQPELRNAVESVALRAHALLEVLFGDLEYMKSEIRELVQIDKVRKHLSVVEVALALTELDVTVEALRQLLGIDGDPIARVVMSTDDANEALRLVAQELERQAGV